MSLLGGLIPAVLGQVFGQSNLTLSRTSGCTLCDVCLDGTCQLACSLRPSLFAAPESSRVPSPRNLICFCAFALCRGPLAMFDDFVRCALGSSCSRLDR